MAHARSKERLALQQQVIAIERLNKVIISVRERHVDFRTLRQRSGGVHEHEVGVFTLFGTIYGAAQRVQNVPGGVQIPLAGLAAAISAQLQQGRGRAGCG